MPIKSVFVYADGQVGLPTLPVDSEPMNWRRVIRSVAHVSAFYDPPAAMAHVDTEEFALRGHMFDGRPIYCATGFDVKEARLVGMVTTEAVTKAVAVLREEMDAFISSEYRDDVILLDQWEGNEPLTELEIDQGSDLEKMHLVKRRIGRLMAVRVQ